MRVLGFMSGTSLDGVDAAIIETDGERLHSLGPARLLPFSDAQRRCLMEATVAMLAGNADPGLIAQAEAVVAEAHLAAARLLLADDPLPIDLVGFHGQTVLHRPEEQFTLQLGDAGLIARSLGVPVIADLRQADLRAGGQGAPLVPIYHAALVDWLGIGRPAAFLNIGGVANLTWLGRDGAIIACDTGPGNGLIDLMVQQRGLGRYDADGQLAAQGTVDERTLARLLEADYFRRTGPKSLDRYDFSLDAVAHLAAPDAAATLAAFTAEAVAIARRSLPEAPETWIVCGGGRHNPALMRLLRERVGNVVSADSIGARGDFIEAEAMAFLAARSTRGLPISFPTTTGVPRPMTGGHRYDPDRTRAA
jgi:anhydro-N-acetylmuramic acid kinase